MLFFLKQRPAYELRIIDVSSDVCSSDLLEGPLPLDGDARTALIASADGDGRFLLNQAETLYHAKIAEPLDPAALGAFLQRRVAVYDTTGRESSRERECQ